MNPRSGDDKPHICPSMILYPYPHSNGICCAVVQAIISHSRHVPLQEQHPTLPGETPWLPNNCISSTHLNQSGVEGLVSYLPRSGRDPRQNQSGGILAQWVVCPTQPHAGAASTHGACLSTAQATAHRGSVSMCSTNRHQAQVTSCLGLFSSPDALGQQVSQPVKWLYSISGTRTAQETIKP